MPDFNKIKKFIKIPVLDIPETYLEEYLQTLFDPRLGFENADPFVSPLHLEKLDNQYISPLPRVYQEPAGPEDEGYLKSYEPTPEEMTLLRLIKQRKIEI